MRAVCLAIVALLGATGPALAADQGVHEMPLDIPTPSRVEQTVRHTKAKTLNGKTESAWVETRSLATIGFDEKAETYKVTLKVLDRTASTPEILPILSATLPAEISYLADESLRPIKLIDAEATKARLIAFAQSVSPQMGAMAEKTFATMSAEGAANLMLKEQSYLSIGYNLGLKVGEPQTYDGEQASPLGSGSVKLKGSVVLDSYDDKAGRALVTWKEFIDPESAMVLGVQTVKQMTGKDVSAELVRPGPEVAKVEATKGCRFEIDTRNGFIRKADCYQSVVTPEPAGSATHERWAITQTLTN
ncbi:hypothetical protein [Caulobacter sp. DWR1-3-2b1]|uniref:hypothetical protein n=1 Tax=Caulobacter sp. DWR1-3-2b1 TaxID=2804670 RepID=UPI003CF319CA